MKHDQFALWSDISNDEWLWRRRVARETTRLEPGQGLILDHVSYDSRGRARHEPVMVRKPW